MTEWSAYRHYRCNQCDEICINHSDTSAARNSFCVDCISQIPDSLLASTPDTSERVEGATPSHGGPTDRVSATPRAERRGESQRESPAGGPERGCGGVRSLMNEVRSHSAFDE